MARAEAITLAQRLAPSVSLGLSRDEQYRKIEHVFADVLSRDAPIVESSGTALGDE